MLPIRGLNERSNAICPNPRLSTMTVTVALILIHNGRGITRKRNSKIFMNNNCTASFCILYIIRDLNAVVGWTRCVIQRDACCRPRLHESTATNIQHYKVIIYIMYGHFIKHMYQKTNAFLSVYNIDTV